MAQVGTNRKNTLVAQSNLSGGVTTFLWLWGNADARLIQIWTGFSNEVARINNGSPQRYRGMSGCNPLMRISDLTREIDRAYKRMNKIDHLIITGHGYGSKKECDPVMQYDFYRDEGAFFLNNVSQVYEVNEDEDPTFIGSTYTITDMFRNKKYKELVKSISDKKISHLHLHTCYTGKGWSFLRQFAIDTKAIIYAYIDYVDCGYDVRVRYQLITDKHPSPTDKPWNQRPPFFGARETSPGQFNKVHLIVSTQVAMNNDGTMLLPGWQVRARLNPADPNDAVIDEFEESNNRFTTYKWNNNNHCKWDKLSSTNVSSG